MGITSTVTIITHRIKNYCSIVELQVSNTINQITINLNCTIIMQYKVFTKCGLTMRKHLR